MASIHEKLCFFLYGLDILSGTQSFKIFDRIKNVSLVGLICTIIFAVIIIIFTIFELIEFFKDTNFSLISMEDNSTKIPAIKYIGNDTIAALYFIKNKIDKNGKQYNQEIPDLMKIFKMKVYQYNQDYFTGDIEYKSYIMQNCTNYFTQEDMLKFDISQYIVDQSVCPPYEQGFKLKWDKHSYSQLYFKISLCNKKEDENCYSEEEIKEKYESGYLDDITFGFIREYNTVDSLNYSTPISINSMMTEFYLRLNNNMMGQCISKFVHYESDDGIIFNNIKNYTGLRIDSFDYGNNNREELFNYKTPLATITYGIDTNYILNYKRKYLKLTTIIVDISGIARVIFLFGGYIVSLLSRNYFSFKLFNEIFSRKHSDLYKNQKNKNAHINNDVNTQIFSNKKKIRENKLQKYDIAEEQSKTGSENNSLKILIRNDKSEKEQTNTKCIISSNIGMKDVNIINMDKKEMNKDSCDTKKLGSEKYSTILYKYLGYHIKNNTKFDKKKFTFWSFICSQFYKGSSKTGIINCCAKMINNCLSFEQMVNNTIDIYILLSYCGSQELMDIDIFNEIIDDDFRKTIKKIKDKND